MKVSIRGRILMRALGDPTFSSGALYPLNWPDFSPIEAKSKENHSSDSEAGPNPWLWMTTPGVLPTTMGSVEPDNP